jgi:hypothetical protein
MNHISAACPGGGQAADAKYQEIAVGMREQIPAGPWAPSGPNVACRRRESKGTLASRGSVCESGRPGCSVSGPPYSRPRGYDATLAVAFEVAVAVA